MIDFRLGADVDADGRLLEHEKTHLRLHPAGENDLLLIAAAQRGDHRLGIPGLDREAVEDDARIGELVATPDGLQDTLSRRDRIDVDILANRHVGGEAFFRSPTRHESDLMPHRVRGIGGIDPAVVQRDMAGRHLDLAEDRAADRMVTGAAQADQAQRLAGLHGKRNRPDMLRDDFRQPRRRLRSDDGAGSTKAAVIERPTIFSTRSAGEVSATGAVATRRPSRRTVTLSAMRNTSSRRCVT